MGRLMRCYWIPALLSEEIPSPDCAPVRVRLLGEDLVAFRDSTGRVGLLGEHCAHRGTSLFFGRNEDCGLRCIYHGWKYDVDGHVLETPAEPAASDFRNKLRHTRLSLSGNRRDDFHLHGRAGKYAADAALRMGRFAAGPAVSGEVVSRMQLSPGHRGRLRFFAYVVLAQQQSPKRRTTETRRRADVGSRGDRLRHAGGVDP